MEKFTPREKLGKKAKRELDLQARGSWGIINPVTKSTKNKKVYDRKRARREKDTYLDGRFILSSTYYTTNPPTGLWSNGTSYAQEYRV